MSSALARLALKGLRILASFCHIGKLGVQIAPLPHRPFLARLILQTEERCSGRPAVEIMPSRSDALHVVAYLRQHRQHRLRH